MINRDKVKCLSAAEKQNMMGNTFSDIFACVLGSDSSKQDKSVSYEDLLTYLLRLLGKLVQTPLPDQVVNILTVQLLSCSPFVPK